MQKPSLLGQFVFWLILAGAVFMTYVGFFGFLGWYSDPSRQKWAALECSLMGAAAIFGFWNMKNELFYPQPTAASDKIENRTVAEQIRYWRNGIYCNLTIGLLGSLILWLVASFYEQSQRSILFTVGYIALLVAYHSLLSIFKLFKLHAER